MRKFLKADLTQVKEHWLAVAAASVAFILSVLIAFDVFEISSDFATQLLLTASLGISIAIASRISSRSMASYALMAATGFILIGLFFFANNGSHYFYERFIQLALITHLWVAIAPAIRNRFKNEIETGRFNWFLLVRIAMVAVQSGILLGGLLLALGASIFFSASKSHLNIMRFSAPSLGSSSHAFF